MASSRTRIINIGLQGATLGTRFLFIFFLAKYLDPKSVGLYGLFTAAVGYSLYFVGLDFYTYATRELLKAPPNQRGRLLKSQAALAAVLYLLFLAPALLFLSHSGWPQYLLLWFFPLLLLEHFNQEMSRFLTAMSEQVAASALTFIRQGSWAVVFVALVTLDPSSRQLSNVFALWAMAGAAAAAAACWKLRTLQLGGWRSRIDWQWIKQGIAVSLAFLWATLAIRGIHTADRYWLEALGGIEIVGAYVIFLGVASTLITFLDAGVFAFTYPILIRLHQEQDGRTARQKVRQMLLYTVILSSLFALVSWLMLPYLLAWIGNPLYSNASYLYPWLLLAIVLNALSLVPHYALYARGQDKPIIHSHLAALVVFVISTLALSAHVSVLAIPIGLAFSFLVILTWKSLAYRSVCRADPA